MNITGFKLNLMPLSVLFSITVAAPRPGSCQTLEPSLSGANQTEEMTVTATRIKEEHARVSRDSQSILIQPNESSRFDTMTQLKKESSLIFTETGRIAPSGFTIPKIRAEDSKLIDVYLEDTLLQDPYSAYPLVEDLDLRAFGSMELHQGISPLDVPNINSIGTIRYRFKNTAKSTASAGLSTGSPYGLAVWGLGIQKSEGEEFRLYARTHQTSGHYQYYSDNSTPSNPSDDTEKTRDNNDQRSHQIIPVFRKTFGAYTLQAFGWFHSSSGGIPSSSVLADSNARENSRGYLTDLSLNRTWKNILVFDGLNIGAHVGKTDDKRDTDDEDRRVLRVAKQATMAVDSNRQGVHLKTANDEIRSSLSFEESESAIKQTFDGYLGTNLKRTNTVGLAGLALSPIDYVLIELKHSEQHQFDKNDLIAPSIGGESNRPRTHKKSVANALSLALGDFDDGVYAQVAKTERLPSLYEEYGNGSTARPNDTLNAEKITHHELGFFTRQFGLDLGASMYSDDTDDKIIFVQVFASASKALNIAKTKIRGYDGTLGWHGKSTSLSFKISDFGAFDTTRNPKKRLPGIPDRIFVTEWREQWLGSVSSYFTARYRSLIYRDTSNSVKLPGAFIYDLNTDYKFASYEIGLALRNLLNTQDVEISSGTIKGRTAYSDFAGAPLPGRQWVVSLVYNME
ncbi:MAG: TonB-dependent receptor [Chitinophagaceae bacterium]|nr:TonB-dependent receptor [Oligoflexus sp.]